MTCFTPVEALDTGLTFAPTLTRGCAGAVGSPPHPTITSARQNVPTAEDRIPRRTERAKNAFKFLTSSTEKTTAPKVRQNDSAAGPVEPVTGFLLVKYS
ncbi:hypothetical protein MTO96_020412 [Rhipicephalus appendiculatus]